MEKQMLMKLDYGSLCALAGMAVGMAKALRY